MLSAPLPVGDEEKGGKGKDGQMAILSKMRFKESSGAEIMIEETGQKNAVINGLGESTKEKKISHVDFLYFGKCSFFPLASVSLRFQRPGLP